MSKKVKITSFERDKDNFNQHTEKGMELLNKSVDEVGVIETVTVSNDEVVISGNARHEVFEKKFKNAEPIIIETDGKKPIIIKRTDIDSGTDKFYRAAILANTVSKHNLNIDEAKVKEIAVDQHGINVEELGITLIPLDDVNVDDFFDKSSSEKEHKPVICPHCGKDINEV